MRLDQLFAVQLVVVLTLLEVCLAFRAISLSRSRLSTAKDSQCITHELESNQNGVEKLDCDGIFTTFANNKKFISEYWQKKPYHCQASLEW